MYQSSANDCGSTRVLFAAADSQWRERARNWLIAAGHDCYTAGNTEEILSLLACGGFGIALIEVAADCLGGQELIHRLRWEFPELVTVAMATVEQRKQATAALQAGAEGTLLIPFDEQELLLETAHKQHRHKSLVDCHAYEQRLEREARERTAEIRRREEELALRLVSASEYRDNETGAHIRRIGLYSGVLAEALGWDRNDVEDIRIAATMHDIGKIGVPDTILLKPGKLTKEEFEVIKTHTVIGAGILDVSDIPLLRLAREIAWCHHEKWNGSGYPRGLSGEDIPEPARIVAIADVYDALVHARVYKPAFPEDEALAIMRADRGTHFDPRIFDCFLDVVPLFRQIREQYSEQALPSSATLAALTASATAAGISAALPLDNLATALDAPSINTLLTQELPS
ncbi:MAG: HD domain-containing phosphohydrolase [Pirellulales bacterium]